MMYIFQAVLTFCVFYYPLFSGAEEDWINGASGNFEEKTRKFDSSDVVGLPGSHDEDIITDIKSDGMDFLDGQTTNKNAEDQQENSSENDTKQVPEEVTLTPSNDNVDECVGPSLGSSCGIPGRDGLPGVNGNPGLHGIPGLPGKKGEPGHCDCRNEVKRITQSEEFFVPNVRQCAWNKLNYAMQVGRISTCIFTKRRSHTTLKVAWHGTTRILCKNSSCCSRWYFTFNGGECITPQPIEGLVFVDDRNTTINIHRSMSVVGLCSDIPSGSVNVGFWVGQCDGGYELGNPRTGWNSVARIIIEEIPL